MKNDVERKNLKKKNISNNKEKWSWNEERRNGNIFTFESVAFIFPEAHKPEPKNEIWFREPKTIAYKG